MRRRSARSLLLVIVLCCIAAAVFVSSCGRVSRSSGHIVQPPEASAPEQSPSAESQRRSEEAPSAEVREVPGEPARLENAPPPAAEIEKRVLEKADDGSIVLMHCGSWPTVEALPNIIAGLRSRGFKLVRLSELDR